MTRSNLEFKKVAFCLFTFLFLSVSPSFLNKKGTSFQKSPFPEDSTSDEELGRMLTLLEYEIKWKEKKKSEDRNLPLQISNTLYKATKAFKKHHFA